MKKVTKSLLVATLVTSTVLHMAPAFAQVQGGSARSKALSAIPSDELMQKYERIRKVR